MRVKWELQNYICYLCFAFFGLNFIFICIIYDKYTNEKHKIRLQYYHYTNGITVANIVTFKFRVSLPLEFKNIHSVQIKSYFPFLYKELQLRINLELKFGATSPFEF